MILFYCGKINIIRGCIVFCNYLVCFNYLYVCCVRVLLCNILVLTDP